MTGVAHQASSFLTIFGFSIVLCAFPSPEKALQEGPFEAPKVVRERPWNGPREAGGGHKDCLKAPRDTRTLSIAALGLFFEGPRINASKEAKELPEALPAEPK